MIVGEAPGAEEELRGEPFIGASGLELNRMLGEAGLQRTACYVTNVSKYRPPNNEIELWVSRAKKRPDATFLAFRDGWIAPPVALGIELLKREISVVQPNLILAFGNLSTWCLTGRWGISDWRGSELRANLPDLDQPAPKVIPTFHPAGVLRQWTWRPAVLADLRRAAAHGASRAYPETGWKFTTRPSFDTVIQFLDGACAKLALSPLRISFDLETRSGHIACAGLAFDKSEAIVIPFLDAGRDYWTLEEESALLRRLSRVLTHKNARVLGQNLLFDCQYTWRRWHFIPRVTQDTMVSWHTQFCELPKALDYQASILCRQYVWWKGGVIYDPLKKDS